MRRVLVTGAAGMLGRAVVQMLRGRGVHVRGCDRAPRDDSMGDVDYVQCDLSDIQALQAACADCDAVVHLGGVSGPGFVFDPPVPPFVVASTNVAGALNALEAAARAGARRLVFASSVVVYWPADPSPGTPPAMLTEDASVDSTETYGASKIAGEQLCRAYAVQGLVDTVSLRIGWVYGPGRTTGCVVKALLQGSPSDTRPQHRRDFVHVEDAARALVLAALRPESFRGAALNVSGASVTHEALEQAVASAIGRPVKRLKPAAAAAPGDPELPPLDLARARIQLGWRPRVHLEDGVRRYALHLGLCGPRDLSGWVGLWRWDGPRCEKAFEYYNWWGTLSEEQARECATSMKEFRHAAIAEDRLSVEFRAADTTRDADFKYDIVIDGWPHDIDPLLKARANNSIKLNPTGQWSHWWEGDALVMEQPCTVRGEEFVHRVTRVLDGDHLRCHELVTTKVLGEERLSAVMAFARAR